MAWKLPKASIVIATYNGGETLKRVLDGMLKLNYSAGYEVIVVNDGSTDGTRKLMQSFSKEKLIKFIDFKENQGVVAARNAGIAKARFEIVVNMDHDCIPEKQWLIEMIKPFCKEKTGIVSGYGKYGGTSTAFRKELLERVGGYDNRYRYFREDTDLSFSIMDLGYDFVQVKRMYKHDHEEIAPKGLLQIAGYVVKRWKHHMNDVLLFKKHPKLAGEFLDIRFGFLVNPLKDFGVATGGWHKKAEFALSSPRGILFVENKTPVHTVIIILGGIVYMLGVKFYRLLGSIKFGKLLL